MRTPISLQADYTLYNACYQIKLPLQMETMIPSDDPVRLLSAFVEGMDLSELYHTYDRIRKAYVFLEENGQLYYTGTKTVSAARPASPGKHDRSCGNRNRISCV